MDKQKDYPNVLIISHNLIDNSNNVGKTLLSMLGDWPSDSLYSLYLRNEYPVNFYCNKYLLIHDKDVFLSTITFGIKKSGIFFSKEENNNKSCSSTETALYNLGNKRKPIVSYLRDMMWHIGFWKNKRIRRWIKEISPDIILFIPNDYCLAFDVLKFVRKIVDTPVITIYTDDAFYYGQNCKGIDKKRRKALLKKGFYVSRISNLLYTTSKEMSREYSQLFNKKCLEFGNFADLLANSQSERKSDLVFSYIGNLHSKRWESICEIGKSLDEINNDLHLKCVLKVYSASFLEQNVKESFDSIKSIAFLGKINPEEVRTAQAESDVLIHVESFDNEARKSTRLSVSTKIFEYLASNRPILAYGPQEVASMKYLSETGGSVLCFSNDDLIPKMKSIIESSNLRESLASNGYLYAKTNLDKKIQIQNFQNIILTECKKQ